MQKNIISKFQGVFGKNDSGMRSKKIDIISRNDSDYEEIVVNSKGDITSQETTIGDDS